MCAVMSLFSLHFSHIPATHNPPMDHQVFADKRNDPCVEAISNLSPYFNFGQLSVQAVMRKVYGMHRLLYVCGPSFWLVRCMHDAHVYVLVPPLPLTAPIH